MNKPPCAKSVYALLFGLVGSFLLLTSAGQAQERYFDQVGYVVEGEFLRFFEDHGGLRVFGYPISPPLVEGELETQYFQSGRLEMDPDGQVHLSLLPYELALRRTDPISEDQVPPGGEYYPATGHGVVLAFLDFYLQYGGPSIFGYPITELVIEDERLVQYFERAIFVWRPELPDGHRVQLGRLGELYLRMEYRDLASFRSSTSEHPITGIDASVDVRAPIVRAQDDEQVVYVRVHDQLGQPVQAAKVEAFVLWPDASQRVRLIPNRTTDRDGVAAFSFSLSALSAVGPLSAGDTIPIQAQVSLDSHQDTTANAFRIWW
jgi:hypothetical protein